MFPPPPLFRNNLTVMDTILLHGRGATESLKVAGKPPGQGSSLRFKMTEALLKECTESESAAQLFLPSPVSYTQAGRGSGPSPVPPGPLPVRSILLPVLS